MELLRRGRVWKFGDQINTDLILPAHAMRLPHAQMHTLAFEATRPGWAKAVAPGDILVAGEDFGLGSSRPIGVVLRACGIAGVVAASINGLGFRNCVNAGLPAMACAGVPALFDDGDIAEIDYLGGEVRNLTRNVSARGAALEPTLAEIIAGGGVIPMLIAGGYIEPTGFIARSV